MSKALYDQIAKENVVRYGTAFEKVLRIIINQYSDRTHFIYELLQNAEDAEATYIKFRLERERLMIYHNGRPFNNRDVEGVCGIANGTKEELQADGTRIGHFGIGFKSVYCYTERPQIYSGGHHFAIKTQIFPEEIAPLSGLDYAETCMILPFNKEEVPAGIAFQEIRDALTRKINADSLLMLRNIADIEILIDGFSDIIDISKERFPLDSKTFPENVFGLSVQTRYQNRNSGKMREQDVNYLYFTDAEIEATAIIFNVDGKELKPVKNSMIYAFFPTARETHQNFYIHAPFDTTPARDNIKEGPEYGKHNVQLVDKLGRLIWFAFTWMRDHGYLSAAGFRNVFPVYEYPENDMLYGLYQNSIDIVAEEAIIPTSVEGEFKKLSDIYAPLWGNIIDVFDVADLRRLIRNRNASWLAKEFTTEAYAEIRRFLNNNFKMKTLDWKDLFLKMDAAFLKEKNLSWMEQLMEKTESYCIRRASRDSHYFNASGIPLVRTDRGAQICARDEEGRLQVYLNNPKIAVFRIESSFLKSEIVHSFYQKALEIPEYNVEQETIEKILPKYVTPQPAFRTKDSVRENIADLKTIKDAIYTNPAVLERISDKYIVTDGNAWYTPSQLYIRSTETRSGYSLVQGILQMHYLADFYLDGSLRSMKLDEDFFRKIGCNYGIRALSVTKDEYLRIANKYGGEQLYRDLRDKIFTKKHISKNWDWTFNYEGFPDVFANMTKERSLSIARFLNSTAERFTIQGELVGASDMHFSGGNVHSMMGYSALGLQLCFIKWIYVKEDPNPHSPIEVDVGDILPDYQKYAKRLVAVLPFKETKDPLMQFLADEIKDQGELELVKRFVSDTDTLIKLAKEKARREAQKISQGAGKPLKDLIQEGDKEQTGSGGSLETDMVPISDRGKENREKKLDKEFAESLEHIISVSPGLSFSSRPSSPEERQFLLQEYNGSCQICRKTIKKYNGEPYFESINVIRSNSLDEHLLPTEKRGWNSLCLCPNCAAEYNHCSKKISTLYDQVMQTDIETGSDKAIEINIELPMGERKTIHYSPRHMIALKEAFKIFSDYRE